MSTEQTAGHQADFEEIRRRQAVERQRELWRERVKREGSPFGYPTGREPEAESLDYDKSKCQKCGAKVDKDFRRVFGDNQNVAWGCTGKNCYNITEVKGGAAKSPDCDGTIDERVNGSPDGAASNLGTGGAI